MRRLLCLAGVLLVGGCEGVQAPACVGDCSEPGGGTGAPPDPGGSGPSGQTGEASRPAWLGPAFAPSNDLPSCRWSSASSGLHVKAGQIAILDVEKGTLNVDAVEPTGAPIDHTRIYQGPNAPDLPLIRLRSLTVEPGGILKLRDPKSDPCGSVVALLVEGAADVQGTVDVRGWEIQPRVGAGCSSENIGAGAGGSAVRPDALTLSNQRASGGGASFATPGGAGQDPLIGGGSGLLYPGSASTPDELVPLLRGSTGGNATYVYGEPFSGSYEGWIGGVRGGAGGGALQLVSCASVSISGTIRAEGNPGEGGGVEAGGGGGGSGGAILIEAPQVTVSGELRVMGGDGGQGGGSYDSGWFSGWNTGGTGGAGASEGLQAQPGVLGADGFGHGGGGGGAGRVRINTLGEPVLAPQAINPGLPGVYSQGPLAAN